MDKVSITDRRLWRFVIIGVVVMLIVRQLLVSFAPKIVFSQSESLDQSVFIVRQVEAPLKRGDYVTFKVPENPFIGRPTFTKRVAGIPGDEIVVTENNEVLVAGELVGIAKPKTRKGEDLFPTKISKIPDNFYFVAGDHIDSYDSRYASFGLVPKYDIGGLAKPVF